MVGEADRPFVSDPNDLREKCGVSGPLIDKGNFQRPPHLLDGQFPYVYRWNLQGRKGQRCAVTAWGAMNSCRVEFADGFRMITSRNAIAKVKTDDPV